MDPELLRRAVWRAPWAPIEAAVEELAATLGVTVYIVGGYLRDVLLEREARDLDLVVVGDGLAFASRLAESLGARVELTPRFLTARLSVEPAGRLDVSTARRESYPSPGALPEVEAAGIEEDLARRDFTINTFALGVAGQFLPGLLAVPGARRDLEAGRLRVLHDGSFEDDPTRILRGAALEARLGFHLEAATEKLARGLSAAGGFATVSGSRLWEELKDPLGGSHAVGVLARLDDLGVLEAVHPGLCFESAAERRVLVASRVIEIPATDGAEGLVERRRAAVLLALAWDLDADGRRALAERLALPGLPRRCLMGRAPRSARRLASWRHARPSEIHAELAGLVEPELAVVAAELGEGGEEVVRRELEEWRRFSLSIRAEAVIEASGASGPAVGRALEETRRARLDGRIGSAEELEHALLLLGGKNAVGTEGGTP